MTNSNGNTGKFDVLTEQIGRFTETVVTLAVTVTHLTLTVKHGFAALKVVSREQLANSSQLLALAQSQPADGRPTMGASRRLRLSINPAFAAFCLGSSRGMIASTFKTEGADQR